MFTALKKASYRLRGHYDGQLGGERFRLDPYHSRFWRKASRGEWEPQTFAVLDTHLGPEGDYVDIGAWIGPTVLFGARRARHVWCFEPDPVAFRHLAWNIELNGLQNVSAFAAAVSEGFGVARMASFGGEAGDSTTSLLNAGGTGGTDALTIGWDNFAHAVDLSRVSLVKMDIEGAEFAVLPTLVPWLRAQRPALYLSTHAPFLDQSARGARMSALARTLAFYDTCTDESGAPVTEADFTSDAGLTRFRSFLFSG
ncbi:MAG: FkbM family methyltransferase [Jhaorihella sp.]